MPLLHHRDFRRLWVGDSLSQFGMMTTTLAMPLLAVRTLHSSPFEVGLLTTFEYLAFLVIGLPAGAWVDRMRRRSVMIVADLGRAALLGWVPLAAALGMLTLAQVYVVVFAVGCLTVFFDVSYQSYLPFLVGRDDLTEGNAKLQGTQSVAQVAGPSMGGLLVQVLTAPYAILANVGTFLWSASWVATIEAREPRPERAAGSNLLGEVREGIAFIVGDPVLRKVAGATATANLWSSAAQGMLIVLLARTLGLSAGVIGLLMAAGAAGGLLGALTARPLAGLIGEGPATWLSLAVSSPLALVQPFLHRDWTLGLFVVAQLGFSAGVVIYNVTQVSFRQRLCPEHLLGRMNASMRFLVWGTMPLGGLLGGALGSAVGVRTTLLIAAIGQSLAFLWVLFSPLRSLRRVTIGNDEDAPARYRSESVRRLVSIDMKLTVAMFLTLDGVMQAPGGPEEDPSGTFTHGGWQAPFVDPAVGEFVTELNSHASAFLLGRRTFDIFRGYWPDQTDPANPIATAINSLPKYVASNSLGEADVTWRGEHPDTARLLSGDVVAAVRALKDEPGDELQIWGSGDLLQTLLRNELVDLFRLMTFPVVLGSGRRLFNEGLRPATMRPAGAAVTESGIVIGSYEPAGPVQHGQM